MINTEELLFVVDEFDSPMKPEPRHQVFKKGLWRRTVHVWVVNDKNQILCQQRSIHMDSSPGMWSPAVTGHIGPTDNYFTGAIRELSEETGIKADPKELELVKIYKAVKFTEYRGIFIFRWNGKAEDIVVEEEEIQAVKFVNLDTLKKTIVYNKSKKWFNSGYEKELLLVIKDLNNHSN